MNMSFEPGFRIFVVCSLLMILFIWEIISESISHKSKFIRIALAVVVALLLIAFCIIIISS